MGYAGPRAYNNHGALLSRSAPPQAPSWRSGSRTPRIYIENESRALLFTKIANTAIERVFILIMVTPSSLYFDAGEF